MSEVIVRMEMPTACRWNEGEKTKRCPIAEWGGACAVTKLFEPSYDNRPSWCPIIGELPEQHGRLGDLDRLAKMVNFARIEAMQKGSDTNPYWLLGDIIAQAKIIVPATERKDDELPC